MLSAAETKLDFDRTVQTEDRFAIRKIVAALVAAINSREETEYLKMLSDALVVQGFGDIVQVKADFVNMLKQKFSAANDRMMQMPKLKLSYGHFLFHLKGGYEEILDGILVTEGNIEFSLIKQENNYQIVRIIFYPRMMENEQI